MANKSVQKKQTPQKKISLKETPPHSKPPSITEIAGKIISNYIFF
jgi:hypothetical protein